jgi:hypothetical protein
MGELLKKQERLWIDSGLKKPKPKDKIDFLYGNLNILDSKATSLLHLNVLLIAIATIVIVEKKEAVLPWERSFLFGVIAMSLIASLLCLLVARISYAFLGKVNLKSKPTNYIPELNALEDTVQRRLLYYWISWRLSVVAIAAFVIIVIYNLLNLLCPSLLHITS